MKSIGFMFVIFLFLSSCSKNKINPDDIIYYRTYYKTDPITDSVLFAFHIPTGFTPNGDGLNEYFQPIAYNLNPDDYLLNIIGESGKIIFESKNFSILFKGVVNGKNVPMQTLGYYIEAKDMQGEKFYFKGQFILFR